MTTLPVIFDQGAPGDTPWPTLDSTDTEGTHLVATVSDSGDTVIHTPALGKAIRLKWIYAINDPVATTVPLIKIRLGSNEVYRVWAIAKQQRKTGAIDAPLIVNLSTTGAVAVTAIFEEV